MLCFPRTYSSSLFSIAKARTVRTLPRASSATPVALAICMETGKEEVVVGRRGRRKGKENGPEMLGRIKGDKSRIPVPAPDTGEIAFGGLSPSGCPLP